MKDGGTAQAPRVATELDVESLPASIGRVAKGLDAVFEHHLARRGAEAPDVAFSNKL